ncbi:MAG: lipopolysaccharide assembly protein LapA domain-containing protein [bacterium]
MERNTRIVVKLLLIIGLLLLLVIFTLQNTQEVGIKLFFWSIHTSKALVILVPLIIGLIVGWLGIPFIVTLTRGNSNAREEK